MATAYGRGRQIYKLLMSVFTYKKTLKSVNFLTESIKKLKLNFLRHSVDDFCIVIYLSASGSCYFCYGHCH